MRRATVLDALSGHRRELDAFKVASISVFGSMARDEAAEGSDVDLLVEFSEPVGLVTPGALKAHLRDQILREAIRAA